MNHSSGAHMLLGAVQFVLRALAARGWPCDTPEFATGADKFAEYGALTGNFAFNEQNGTFDALTMRGTIPNGRHPCRRFVVVFRHANANKPQAQAMVQCEDDQGTGGGCRGACLIVVQQQPLSQQAKAVLCEAFGRVDAFTYDACAFDAMRNPQVPRHRRLHRAERERLFARMARTDLPRMLHTDPVCAWNGWSRGTVVEVWQQRHCGLVSNFRMVT